MAPYTCGLYRGSVIGLLKATSKIVPISSETTSKLHTGIKHGQLEEVVCIILTLCMLGNFFKYFFLSKDVKNHCLLPNILLIYNLNVKQFGSQMKPHILWGFIWIQIVCIGHQRSSKFTASGLRVNMVISLSARGAY